MIGKHFIYVRNNYVIWEIEIVGETLTHYYVRNVKSNRHWNEAKRWFGDSYKEIVAV